jgi:hypothetical protein
LSSIAADLSYDNARNTFAINDLTGQLGQAGFNLAGNAYRVGDNWLGALVATVDAIDVPTALSYVPTDANIDAADWARMNMTKGVVNNLQIYLTGQVAANDMAAWQVTDLFGDFGLTDMSVQYQWALPPATDVVGQGRFDREAVIIDLSEGRIDTVLASDTQIVINDFDAEHPALVVTGRAVGPFKDILTALNHPRFGYADYLGLNLRELGGTVDANMRFALPLNATLRAEQVEVDIDGKLIGVKTNGLFGGLPIRKANLDTVISGEGLVARGSVEAGGMPLTINWHQYFDADAEVATALDFRGTITDRNLADLGLNTAPYLTGSIGVDGRVVDYNGGNTDIQMTATLGDARLAVPEIDFKPEPTPGSLLASISILPDDTISITSASLSSNAITVDASAVFNPDGSYGVRASRLQWGGTDVSFGFDAAADGAWEVVLEGASLDLRHLLGRDREPADDPAQSVSNANSRPFGWLLDSSALVADDGPAREITYAVEKVITNDDIGFTKVRGRIALTPQNWPSLLVRGELGDVPVSAEISGTRPNPLKVRFESGDLGALLAAYDADIPLIGGRFVFDGTGEPWSRGDVTLNGTVDLQDFRLGEAAVLSRTVDALSRGGLTTINENAGLGFRQFTADIALDKGQLTVREGRARGAQFGFTLGGAVDLSNETLDLNGTLVPIYTLNRWIGAIPVIGTLLTGGEGEGLFAANYTVDGSFAEPDIKINPLSALAPGIIRKLLFAQDDNSIPSDATKEIDPPPGMVDHGG